jgi:DNA-binding transcriptional LysR family regulator
VDEALREHGLERRIALRVPDFYSALAIIARSDLILTAPSALARLIPRDFNVISLPPPLRLPGHSINLIWHERFTKDPSHAWLRSIVATIAKASC